MYGGLVQAKSVECSNDRLAKKWIIDERRIVLQDNFQGDQVKRGLASLSGEIRSFRTQLTADGVSKVIQHEGLKYSIHIKNIHSPSEIEDYVAIKNNEGHEIIYPLSCN